MLNQKEAVFQAVINVMGKQDSAYTPDKEQRAQIAAILVEGFKANEISLEKEFDDKNLKTYVSGLTSNWLRKDKRLNGNVTYVASNPGSRQSSGDPQLKAMRTLQSQLTSPADKAEVQAHIDARVAEITLAKVKTIDLSALPAELRAKFTK
jgi:hypothetical protein